MHGLTCDDTAANIACLYTKENNTQHGDNNSHNKKRKLSINPTMVPELARLNLDTSTPHLDSPEAVSWIKDTTIYHSDQVPVLIPDIDSVPDTVTSHIVTSPVVTSPVVTSPVVTLPVVTSPVVISLAESLDTQSDHMDADYTSTDSLSHIHYEYNTLVPHPEQCMLLTSSMSPMDITFHQTSSPKSSLPAFFPNPPELSQTKHSIDSQLCCPCCDKIMTFNHECDDSNDSEEACDNIDDQDSPGNKSFILHSHPSPAQSPPPSLPPPAPPDQISTIRWYVPRHIRMRNQASSQLKTTHPKTW
jgi:hypothetical protein